MASKVSRKKRRRTPSPARAKLEAGLATAEVRMVRGLKEELQLGSNDDVLSEAIALFWWAVGERKLGRRIFSEGENGQKKEVVIPRLERLAPERELPLVDISWTARELECLAELASREPDSPTQSLIRALE